jgi:hypothetical protein
MRRILLVGLLIGLFNENRTSTIFQPPSSWSHSIDMMVCDRLTSIQQDFEATP